MVFFRAGTRKNEQMQPIAEQLSNEDVRNLGAYFASLTPPKGPKDDDPDLSAKGKQAAQGRRPHVIPIRSQAPRLWPESRGSVRSISSKP